MMSLLAWKTTAKPLWTRVGLVVAGLLVVVSPAWSAPKFETSLDRDTIRYGETATLSMTFTDCSPDGRPTLPAIAGISYGGTGESTQTVFDGSSLSQTSIYTLELRPNHPGDFTIPGLSITIKGNRLSSRALKLKVLAANAPSPQGEPTGNEPAFVRVIPSTHTIYLGQTIPVKVECYCNDNVGNVQLPQFNANDFILGTMPRDPQRTRVRVGNTLYNLMVFSVPATATKTGALALGPATWALSVGQRTFFGFMASQQVNVSSDAPEVHVLPVPTNGAPPTFNGAIGNFTLAQCEAGPTAVGVGDPITLKVRIAGSGNFSAVTLPASEPGWREFKTYPPTSKFESTDPLQIDGSKYFEQVISPLNDEVKAIPPLTFSYFDPAAGAFRTLTHAAIPLSVHPTAATPQPTVIASGAAPEAPAQNQEIVHIKPAPGVVSPPAPPLVRQPLFLMAQAIAPLLWLGALGWRRQKEKLANNPRLRRRREVARLVNSGLAELSTLAAGNEADKFYSAVLVLLREQLGERLDLPAPAITEAVLEECKGLDAPSVSLLRDLFRACDQYRYTPEHTVQELASMIPKVKRAVDGLRQMPEAGGGQGKRILQGVGCLLLLLGLARGARAGDVSTTFLQANKLYEEGKYAQAGAAYEGLLRDGQISPAIYFNAGDAWFKAGQMGRAIYDFRRAEELAPRDPDIHANLQIAREHAGAGTAALPGNRWTRWVGRVTLNEWTWCASASVALFFLLLTGRQISPALAKASAGWPPILGGVSVWLLACLGWSVDQHLWERSSIVLVSEAVVRRGPMDESQSAFTAHDGAELLVLAQDGDWLQVSDAAKRVGWVPHKEVALMP
jgi:tetratricopeptide (TPR) repeat protein